YNHRKLADLQLLHFIKLFCIYVRFFNFIIMSYECISYHIMNPIIIYHRFLLLVTIFIMHMINRFTLKIAITTISFFLTIIIFSMLKPNIIMCRETSIYYMLPNIFTKC